MFAAAAVLLLLLLPALSPAADDDLAKHPSCRFCGMDRQKWNFSRVFLQYDDGTTEGTCSIHCAAVDLALNLDKSPAATLVADYGTKQLIDATTAVWVIGGKKQGVMTKRAKWAFGTRADADAFIRENEGAIVTFDEVMESVYRDMHEDTKMIRDRRAAKRKAAAEEKLKGAPAAK
jgi:nitrous oxide reductase accessory protein NosL